MSDDKRAITGVVAGSYTGVLLPLQIIYTGKTPLCEAKAGTYPSDWHITHTESHWSNSASKLAYLQNVMKPFIDAQRKQHEYPSDTKALVLLDYHESNLGKDIHAYFESQNWCYKLVPASCTDFCQPMDLSVNRVFKQYLRQQWTTWHGQQLMMQLKQGIPMKEIKIDATLTYLKPIHAGCVITAWKKLKKNTAAMKKGCELMGLNKKPNRHHGAEEKTQGNSCLYNSLRSTLA